MKNSILAASLALAACADEQPEQTPEVYREVQREEPLWQAFDDTRNKYHLALLRHCGVNKGEGLMNQRMFLDGDDVTADMHTVIHAGIADTSDVHNCFIDSVSIANALPGDCTSFFTGAANLGNDMTAFNFRLECDADSLIK